MMRKRGIRFGFCFKCAGVEAREFAYCKSRGSASAGMSGLELFETLRGNRDTLPVIIVSGRADA